MIVLDASGAVSALLNDGAARELLRTEQVHAPHLIDSEISSAFRRKVHAGEVSAMDAGAALEVWRRLGLQRYPAVGLLARMWELRDNASAYDATYIALAENLEAELVTADGRLSRIPGIRCTVRVVPR